MPKLFDLFHRHDTGVGCRRAGASQQRRHRCVDRRAGVPRSQDRPGVDARRRSARTAGRSPDRTTRPSIRRRRTCRSRSPNNACAAGRSAPCRSRPARPCRSSPWTTRRCGRCRASAGRPCCISTTTAATPIDPVIECRFTNGGNAVMDDARPRPDDGAQRTPGARDLWPKNGRLRRPCRVVPRNSPHPSKATTPAQGEEKCDPSSSRRFACPRSRLHWRARSRPGGRTGRSDRISRDPDRQKSLGLPAVRCRLVARAHLHADSRRRLGGPPVASTAP